MSIIDRTFYYLSVSNRLLQQGSQALLAGEDPTRSTFQVHLGDERRTYDTSSEWYASRGNGVTKWVFSVGVRNRTLRVTAGNYGAPYVEVMVDVDGPMAEAERIMELFSSAAADAANQIPRPEPEPEPETEPEPEPEPAARVFLGHGRSQDWRDIKDELQKHHYEVEAYETAARAGHSIRDVLESMLRHSTIAFLILTGEDFTADETVRARQNVVHEAGLFQGRLGFGRGIAVVEEGVEMFSNLDGVQQIRYAKGHVKAAMSDIIATIEREFPDGKAKRR